jgi:hypothetical protein
MKMFDGFRILGLQAGEDVNLPRTISQAVEPLAEHSSKPMCLHF